MGHKSDEEILAEYVDVLGEDFASDFRAVENRYYILRLYWRLYQSFFCANSERVDLLNYASRMTAWALEQALFDQVVLHLCRLLDPAESRGGRDQNLSFRRLAVHVESLAKKSAKSFSELVEKAEQAAKEVRDIRNRRIAHLDLDVAHNRVRLQDVTIEAVDGSIEAAGNLIQWILHEFFDSSSELDPHLGFEDEMRFLRILYLGVEVEKSDMSILNRSLEDYNLSLEPVRREYPKWLTMPYYELKKTIAPTQG